MSREFRVYWIAFGVFFSLIFPLFGNVLAGLFFPNSRIAHLPFHSLVEAIGGLMAISIAGILLVEQSQKKCSNHYLWMANGLIAMGVLDLFHAAVDPGNLFIWFHSSATFFGGMFFALVWFDRYKPNDNVMNVLPILVFGTTIIFGIASCLASAYLPVMVVSGQFSLNSRLLNFGGGLGFWIAGFYFIYRFHQKYEIEDWLFAVHTTLFGAAGFLFELSQLWDPSWWWWHVLRLIAYLAALTFAIRAYLDAENELFRLNNKLKVANDRMKSNLESAARVQYSHLPSKSLKIDGCKIAWAFSPCDQLGGDLFNIFDIDEQHTGLYVLDVAGHGVESSLMAFAVSQILKPNQHGSCLLSRPDRSNTNNLKTLQINSPANVIRKLNERFNPEPELGKFITMIYGVYDKALMKLTITSAGHPPPVIHHKNGRIHQVDLDTGFPIGLLENHDMRFETYKESTFQLEHGDRICFFSDGVIEAMNRKGKTYGIDRLQSTLAENGETDLNLLATSLHSRLLKWTAPSSPRDDISLLLVELE